MAAMLSMGLTLSLGFWQLDRANTKLQRQAQIQQQSSLPALDRATLLGTADLSQHLFRTLRVKGRWLPQHSVYLDNRQMDGKAGLLLLTPFELSPGAPDQRHVILVQRGWVARNFLDRERLPDIRTVAGETELLGRLVPSPSKLYEFKEPDRGLIRQNVTIDDLAREFKLPLLSLSLQQLDAVGDTEGGDGLRRNWPQPQAGVEKHYGYMVQWWALSGLIAGLYLWHQVIRGRARPKPHSVN